MFFMLIFRPRSREPRTYTLDEAAEFLDFDREAIRYWLRMGHLAGRRDHKTGEWRIQPQALIEFLREAQEPMPTGARAPAEAPAGVERTPARA
jgi:hypothetical protein